MSKASSLGEPIMKQPLPTEDIQALNEAFSKFSETSVRLQSKYQELLNETQVLRETLKSKDEEIKRRERLSMLGETAAAIAHEVRNPLGAIKIFVSLLRSDCAERADSLQLIDQIDQSINALDHVVSNILQFSKDKKLSFAPVNIHSVIQEQLLCFPRTDSNQAVFELVLRGNPYIHGCEASLRQVIYNLILNGLQATQYKGAMLITTCDTATGIQLVIRDNGKGIDEKILPMIFEPFITSKNEGTGLGLSIVKQIIEQHFGKIAASNDNGAVFTIDLPRKGEVQQ
jgi:two-component system sensor histidine kinase HydH